MNDITLHPRVFLHNAEDHHTPTSGITTDRIACLWIFLAQRGYSSDKFFGTLAAFGKPNSSFTNPSRSEEHSRMKKSAGRPASAAQSARQTTESDTHNLRRWERALVSAIDTAIITERLGASPEAWTFFGQCFQAGEQSQLKCAILQEPSRYFFTLKPIDGSPGRRYIGFEAIPYLKYRNPELYRRLKAGVALLEMQNNGFDRQESWRNSK